MLQRRGWLTSMNAVPWLLNFSNSLPKGHWVLIFISPWFRHLWAKGAVTLSNSKGGFRGGPKGAFFCWNYFVLISYRTLRIIKSFYIAGKWASVPATLFWIFWIHLWLLLEKMSSWEISPFSITNYLETKNQFQHTANNTKCTCMYCMPLSRPFEV